MHHEKGFRRLPLSVKIIFVVLTLGMISSFFYINYIAQSGYPLLWITLSGTNAIIALFALNFLCTLLLLFGIWQRAAWTWEYGMLYFGFFALNGIISAGSLFNTLYFAPMQNFEALVNLFAVIFGIILNSIFLIIIYRKRFYFENEWRF
ncbi:MAG: hypothetical protein AABX16_00195 [Nanoarchaeota archaeon]